jgi:hypothetical protein
LSYQRGAITIGFRFVEIIIFGLLSILGLFGLFYSSIILRALVKHRKDRAPLTSYFLNPQMAKVPYFIYAGIFGFFTGLMIFINYLSNGFNPVSDFGYALYLFELVFGVLTAIFIVLDLRFWYKRFRRFVQ